MTDRPIVIGMLWHSANSDNLGVGALTAGHLAILDKVAEGVGVTPEYRVIGWKDARPHYIRRPDLTMAELRTRDLVRPSGLWSVVRGCDMVLDIGAGDSFADIYGASRFTKNAVSKAITLIAGTPLVLSPQTLGPYSRPWARRAAVAIMRRSRKVLTRDALSTKFARDIGFDGEVIEATDVAFRLPFDRPAPRNGEPVRVGINASGLLINGGYSKDNMFALKADYGALVREIIRRFQARDGVEVHLIGHVISDGLPVEDDYRAAKTLAEEFPGVIVAPKFGHPSEAKSYIAGLDFFTGSRMHACIAAFSARVPVLPLAYSRKFAGLFGTLGYEETADCRSEDADAILAKMEAAFDGREALKTKIDASLAEADRRLGLYEGVLADLMREAAGGR